MSSFKFRNIMIIDDNNIDLYITSRMVKKHEIAENVLSFCFAGDALEYLHANQSNPDGLPELILVDIYMPMMSGFDFLREYNKLPADFKNPIKVFIVSSSIDDSDIEKANNDKNVTAFWEKPITREFLENL